MEKTPGRAQPCAGNQLGKHRLSRSLRKCTEPVSAHSARSSWDPFGERLHTAMLFPAKTVWALAAPPALHHSPFPSHHSCCQGQTPSWAVVTHARVFLREVSISVNSNFSSSSPPAAPSCLPPAGALTNAAGMPGSCDSLPRASPGQSLHPAPSHPAIHPAAPRHGSYAHVTSQKVKRRWNRPIRWAPSAHHVPWDMRELLRSERT